VLRIKVVFSDFEADSKANAHGSVISNMSLNYWEMIRRLVGGTGGTLTVE
jgi:hypothetical protein